MKRITTILAASLILLTASTTAFASPENSAAAEQQSITSESEKTENSEQSKKTDGNSDKAQSSNPDPEKTVYREYRLDDIDMSLSLPSDIYVITPDIQKDDPALKETNQTKEDVVKNFTENGILLKAAPKDSSYDITVTMTENETTRSIDNISSLSEEAVNQIADSLLENDFAVGCSKNTYNGTLFLTLDTEIKMGDTTNYGVLEYTIVNGQNVIIKFQSNTGKINKNQQSLLKKIMSGTVFDGVEAPVEIQDAASTNVTELDPRYITILISAIVGLIALALMIIVGTRYRQSHNLPKLNDDDKFIIKTPKTSIKVDDNTEDEVKNEKKDYDTSIFEPSDENILFKNKKLEDEKKQREKTKNIPRLDSTMELNIPKNPYTPVGKAEAVEQPAMSVTSEIAKLSSISVKDAKAAREAKSTIEDTSAEPVISNDVVYAESMPKPKTEITQIGEDVFESTDNSTETVDNTKTYEGIFGTSANIAAPVTEASGDMFSGTEGEIIINDISENSNEIQPENEPSEYEKRFGKGRKTTVQGSTPDASEETQPVSKFEKHFGKLQPAVSKENIQNDIMTAVDAMIEQENPSADIKEQADATTHDKSLITVTKAPPVIPEPLAKEDPVVKITKKSPMPDAVKVQTATSESTTPKAENKTAKNNEVKPEEIKTADKAEENPQNEKHEKKTIFQKFTEKLFEPDEQTEQEQQGRVVETNRESTNKFINSIKDKLQYREPEYEDEQKKPENKTDSDGTEIYRSHDAAGENQIELAVIKSKDGSIVIDSINDKTGKPVKIAIKNGDAELKSKSKKKNKKSNKNKNNKNNASVSAAAAGAVTAAVKTTEAAADTAVKSASAAVKDTAQKSETAKNVISAAESTVGNALNSGVSANKANYSDKLSAPKKNGKTKNKAVPDNKDGIAANKAAAASVTKKVTDNTPAGSKDGIAANKAVAASVIEKVTDNTPAGSKDGIAANKAAVASVTEKVTDNTPAGSKDGIAANKAAVASVTEKVTDNTPASNKDGIAANKAAVASVTKKVTDNTPASNKDGIAANKAAVASVTKKVTDNTPASNKDGIAANKAAVASATEKVTDNTPASNKDGIAANKAAVASVTEKIPTDAQTVNIPNNTSADTKTEKKTVKPVADNAKENKSNTFVVAVAEERNVLKEKSSEAVSSEAEASEPKEPEFVFERDTGIIFERAILPADNFTRNITPLTSIPKLESVNANDYNKKIEEMHKQSNIIPEPQSKVVPPPVVNEQASYYPNNDDDTLDPFAPGSGEMTLKEIDKKTTPKLKDRLKRSFGKIFSGTDDEK